MLLSARALQDVANVNSFEPATTVQMTAGDAGTFYFQLIDKSLDLSNQGFSPAGRRYMPAAGSTLSVKIMSINDALTVTRVATQPFPLDPSIWSIPLLATDMLNGSYSMRLTLTEGGVAKHGFADHIINFFDNGCGC